MWVIMHLCFKNYSFFFFLATHCDEGFCLPSGSIGVSAQLQPFRPVMGLIPGLAVTDVQFFTY